MSALAIGPGVELCDGRYVLEERLGRGGMATVWLGRDTRLARAVAVKVLSEDYAADPGYVERFRREARLAAGLSHPNLVKVFDFEPEGRPALIMEYVQGGSLDDVTRDDATAVDPVALATQVLSALDHIHSAGIVHRDVKPGNILLGPDGRAMLTDFGIAQPEDATRLTQTGQVIGTLRYMAPEVQEGDRATPRADLYSTGMVLREHLGPDAPDGLRRLVDRLTERDPGHRPASVERAMAYLERELNGAAEAADRSAITRPMPVVPAPEPPRAGPPPSAPAQTPPRQYPIRGRHVLAGLALLAVAIAAVVIATSGGDSEEPAPTPASSEQAEQPAEETETTEETAPPEEPAPAEEEPVADTSSVIPEPKPNADPAKGTALEGDAFETLQSGDAEGAIKLYEKALAEFPLEARDPAAFDQYPSYAYALYSYGDALLQVGRADEAVAVLEERLAFTDQRDTVEAKLAEAQAEAGG
jgi:eukaryotic-like serine/threonine-protein kinase